MTQLQLPRLGLEGTLPGQLAQLPSLALLDLSGNAYEGGIPEAWLQPAGFPSLATALLAGNRLGGAPPLAVWLLWAGATCLSLLPLDASPLLLRQSLPLAVPHSQCGKMARLLALAFCALQTTNVPAHPPA